jgi:hypothetical protein
MLTEIGLCGGLFHTPAGAAFADILVNNQGNLADTQHAVPQLVAALPL